MNRRPYPEWFDRVPLPRKPIAIQGEPPLQQRIYALLEAQINVARVTGGQTLFNTGSQPPYSPGYTTGTTNPGLKMPIFSPG
jgi:hypothetical protein